MATIDLQERPRGREELFGWYSELFVEQASSGLSVAEYAVSLGIAPTTLYQWKRRLARTMSSRAERKLKRETREGLIQLSLPRHPAPIVVRLAGGRRVEVPDVFDEDALQRLLSVLDRC